MANNSLLLTLRRQHCCSCRLCVRTATSDATLNLLALLHPTVFCICQLCCYLTTLYLLALLPLTTLYLLALLPLTTLC